MSAAVVIQARGTGPKPRTAAGTTPAIVLSPAARTVSAAARSIVPARTSRGITRIPSTFPVTLPRLLLPQGLRQDQPGGAVVSQAPNPAALAAAAACYTFSLRELAHAARYLVPVAGFGSLLAYGQGLTPGQLWGPAIARSLAQSLGHLASEAAIAELITSGAWVLWTDGESINATEAATATAAGLGAIPGAYTGRAEGYPDGWAGTALKVLDQFNFSLGAFGMVAPVAGGEAVAAEAVAVGAARSADDAAALVGRTMDPRVVGTAGRVAPEAAVTSARTSLGAWNRILASLNTRTATQIPKWAAIGVIGAIGVKTLPDVVNTNREAANQANRAGLDAAGQLLRLGIERGDPALIQAALEHFHQFQAEAGQSDKWLWAAAAFAAGVLLQKR